MMDVLFCLFVCFLLPHISRCFSVQARILSWHLLTALLEAYAPGSGCLRPTLAECTALSKHTPPVWVLVRFQQNRITWVKRLKKILVTSCSFYCVSSMDCNIISCSASVVSCHPDVTDAWLWPNLRQFRSPRLQQILGTVESMTVECASRCGTRDEYMLIWLSVQNKVIRAGSIGVIAF